MSIISTEGPISSRTFGTRMMEAALKKMPSSQRANIRRLARILNARTSMGYYAALDVLANWGCFPDRNSS